MTEKFIIFIVILYDKISVPQSLALLFSFGHLVNTSKLENLQLTWLESLTAGNLQRWLSAPSPALELYLPAESTHTVFFAVYGKTEAYSLVERLFFL